jgi:hypothetical protein
LRLAAGSKTAIVYICSPDRYRQLWFSLSTLLKSGTRFDEVLVYCVGADPRWNFGDARVVVRPVADRSPRYFYGNKLYVCDADAERVVFLDTDTLVFSPLDGVWAARSAPVIARVASAYGSANWNAARWHATCARFGSGVLPMFNTGFVVFQGGVHRRLERTWQETIALYRAGILAPPFEDRMSDQYGLPLAMLAAGIGYAEMSPQEHTFGWLEPTVGPETVVFHTANSLFETYLARFRITASIGPPP